MVASDCPDRHFFEVLALEERHHSIPFLVGRVEVIMWVKVVTDRNEELTIVKASWRRLTFNRVDGVKNRIRIGHVSDPAEVPNDKKVSANPLIRTLNNIRIFLVLSFLWVLFPIRPMEPTHPNHRQSSSDDHL